MSSTPFRLGLICLAFAAPVAEARPVSYPGGWTMMQEHNGDLSRLLVHYTLTTNDAVGVFAEVNWEEDARLYGVQANRLVQRWNGDASQANLYVKAALGVVDPFAPDGEQEAGGFLAVSADWETRRWFVSWDSRVMDYGRGANTSHAARFGLAPYIADYGGFHTWLMLEATHRPDAREDRNALTPLVRVFKGTHLVEIGYTPQTQEFMINWIKRF